MAGVGTVTFSAGVCDLARATDSETLYRLADGALYWAKAGGRNRVVVYRPEVVEDLSAAERVDRLEHGHAQAGVRALARMVDARHPSTVGHSERVAELVSRLASARDWDLLRAVPAARRRPRPRHRQGRASRTRSCSPRARWTTSSTSRSRPMPRSAPGSWPRSCSRSRSRGCAITTSAGTAAAIPTVWPATRCRRAPGCLALAEAFDVMRSERSYASTLSLADALAECRAGAGSQFAPTAVEALLGLAEADLLGQAV
jgi:hypothetical protein